MKSLKFFLLISLLLSVFVGQSQMQQIKSTRGKILNYGRVATLTTPSNTLTLIDSIVIKDNSAGIIDVQVVGYSAAGDGVTSWKAYRYHKSSGTLTIDSTSTLSQSTTDTGLGSGTVTFTVTASNNLQLKVRGNTSIPVNWRSRISQFTY